MRNNSSREAQLIKKIITVVIAFNVLSLVFLAGYYSAPRSLNQNSDLIGPKSSFLTAKVLSTSNPTKFVNPSLALKILTQLDVFEPIHPSYLGIGDMAIEQYDREFLGLKNDPEYCNKHRAHFVNYPEIVFDQKNFIIEHGPITLLRKKVAKQIATDIMPNIGRQMPKSDFNSFTYDIDLAAGLYFTTHGIHRYKSVGEHFACLSQVFNHIPGHYSLNRKDTIAEKAIQYAEKFVDRPECFNYDKYFPKTWLLYDKESCENFFEEFNSPAYYALKKERHIVYIKKVAVGSHRGQGVTPLDDENEGYLRDDYQNGALCGRNDDLLIVQNYVHNPLLLHGRKFDFRMYMVIASVNPLMVFYHDGFLRVSLYDYDVENYDKKVLLTNLALNQDIYDDAKQGKLHHGMNQEDLKIAQQWSFERLQEYLLSEGVINDPNWLDNYLRPEFKKAMIHLVKMSSVTFARRSQVYEFYGVDFMLDENLTLWFLEANSGPALDGYSVPMEAFIVQMLKDHFELAFGMTRSRMKRVVRLVNTIIEEGQYIEKEGGEVDIRNYHQWREAFLEASKNRYEPEYAPSPTNGYVKIMDENLEGSERYMGLIDEHCF